MKTKIPKWLKEWENDNWDKLSKLSTTEIAYLAILKDRSRKKR